MNDHVGTPGLTRTDLYRRFARTAREVLERSAPQEGTQPEMVVKIDIHEQLNRLRLCPVCGAELVSYEAELIRSCRCGDFVITSVWSDGDVEFMYKMSAEETTRETVASENDGD